MTNDCLLDREVPVVLVVADEARVRTNLREALERAGWYVRWTTSEAQACTIAARMPISLVLLDLVKGVAASPQAAISVRNLSGPAAAVPIIAVRAGACDNGPKSNEVDALITGRETDTLVRALDSWRPVSLAPTRRIAEMLGAGPIAWMIERLARRLEAALAHLDGGGDLDRSEAHRLAGLCGTLGFGQAHAAWLDFSLGDRSAVVEARRTTRLTLSAIARGL
jgi:CheY-like chemotaxis protein